MATSKEEGGVKKYLSFLRYFLPFFPYFVYSSYCILFNAIFKYLKGKAV